MSPEKSFTFLKPVQSASERPVQPAQHPPIGVCKVVLATADIYRKALNSPFRLAQKAHAEGSSELHLYIQGRQKPEIRLRVSSVIRIGHRVGAI